jgi:hypothetical protein
MKTMWDWRNSSTSALDGGEQSASHPCHFTPRGKSMGNSEKSMEGNGFSLIYGATLAFAWKETHNNLVRIVRFPVMI